MYKYLVSYRMKGKDGIFSIEIKADDLFKAFFAFAEIEQTVTAQDLISISEIR